MLIQNERPLSDVQQEQQAKQEREHNINDIPAIRDDQEIVAETIDYTVQDVEAVAETVTLNAEDLAVTADTVNALLEIITDLQTRVETLENGGNI